MILSVAINLPVLYDSIIYLVKSKTTNFFKTILLQFSFFIIKNNAIFKMQANFSFKYNTLDVYKF